MSGVQAYRRRALDTERMVDQAVADVKAEQAAEFAAAREARRKIRAELEAMPTVNPELIVPGVIVRTRGDGLGAVVKVNRKTVDVIVAGFPARWPLDSIVHVYEKPNSEGATQ